MNEANTTSRERISALVDGDLRGDACARAVTELLDDKEAVRTWHTYQVVGDVLRSAELAPTCNDLAFWEKLEARLTQEPQRPDRVEDARAGVRPMGMQPSSLNVDRPGANASSSAGRCWQQRPARLVGVVGLGLWTQTGQSADARMAAAVPNTPVVPQVVTAESNVGTMMRDPQLDELMAAHRQLGGHSALQVPAGFLRNATYEGAGR
jgi:sigma-E factor negative regulatory protein RseA